MKHILLLLIILISTQWLIAQEPVCGETPNGISTNPGNSINEECDGNLINNFDWRVPMFNAPYYQGTSNNDLPSPFFEPNTAIREINDHIDFVSARDMEVEDGWELIIDGVSQIQSATTTSKIAYFVIYNKHTAILRVFGAHHEIGPNDYMAIHLIFKPTDNSVSGLLHPTAQIAQPLDQKSISEVHANAKISGDDPLHFFYADFPMGYDPCTCILNVGTIDVEFQAINEQFIEMYGRSWGLDGTLANIEGGKIKNSENYLMNVYSDQGNIEAGSLIFNSIDELESLYDDQKHKASHLNKMYQLTKDYKQRMDILTATASLGDPLKVFTPYLKAMSKYVDVLSMPMKKRTDAANAAVTSTGKIRVIQSEMTFSGTITDYTDKESFTFRLPGRSGNSTECSDYYYPRYNEVLGRFALLKTPEVKVGTKIEPVTNSRFTFDNSSFQYLFNPAAKINENNTKIYGSLVVKHFKTPCTIVPLLSGGTVNSTTTLSLIEGLSSEDTTVLTTSMLPIECLGSLTSSLDLINFGQTCNPQYELYLKLLILYEFDQIGSDGFPIQSFEIITYPVKIESIPHNTTNSLTVNDDGSIIQNNLTISTVNYNTTQTIFAWDTIFINGDLTANTDIEVEIAASTIIMNSGSIGQGITLVEKETPFASCTPIEPFDSRDLLNYCTDENPTYKANQDKNVRLIEPNPVADDKPTKPIPFQSTPNPFNNSFNIEFELAESGETSLIVYDALGRVVETVIMNDNLLIGKHQYQIDGTKLGSGIYYVKLNHNNGSQTIKIIKQ